MNFSDPPLAQEMAGAGAREDVEHALVLETLLLLFPFLVGSLFRFSLMRDDG